MNVICIKAIVMGDRVDFRGSSARGKRRLVVLGLALAGVAPAALLPQPLLAQAAAQRAFDIPPQSLGEALADFGQQSGLQVSVDAANIRGATSPGASGRMTAAQALGQLLSGSGFTYRIDGNVVTLERVRRLTDGSEGPIVTDTLRVETSVSAKEDGATREARLKDDVYYNDYSTSFAGKAEVERYKGVTPSDVLKGQVNVFSGDARNSGALDPSIRGISGPGRVPVIIDGTEQALTVWRGYNGASNRSYIDPSLIAGVQVLRGAAGQARGIRASTGGAVVVNTLDAEDIIQPGKAFGAELRLEGGNNSVDPHIPVLSTGKDFRDIPGFPNPPTTPYNDPTVHVPISGPGGNDFFSMGDKAVRLAVAGRLGDFDLFGAYAYRQRGDYFSGDSGTGYYSQAGLPFNTSTYVRTLALNYRPGSEVPNTSSEMESWLAKATWRIADDQYLQFSFRDSRSIYGEILPSRIMEADGFGNIQWPLSRVHARAYNAEYKWQPESRWIDVKANLWKTDTGSHTYSAGGFPNYAPYNGFDNFDAILRNTALANAQNNRWGFTASNNFRPTERLSILVDGNYQREKLTSPDVYTEFDGWRQFPRAGRREEFSIRGAAEWKPRDFVTLTAGIKYSGYWAFDDFVEANKDNANFNTAFVTTSYSTSYNTRENGPQAAYDFQRQMYLDLGFDDVLSDILAQSVFGDPSYEGDYELQRTGPNWTPGADGKYRRASNPCLNGSLGSNVTSCTVGANVEQFSIVNAAKKARKWTPDFAVRVDISPTSRVYARYAESYRYPSMFESTLGFSASFDPLRELKPEHNYSVEAAFVQDFRDLLKLKSDEKADIKITYYRSLTRDVIERDTRLLFSNIERQIIEGLELQARFDNGRFFTDLSAAHTLRNMVCDESAAVLRDPGEGRVADCVKYGFLSGYLLTQATPDNSVNLTVGGRLLQRRLELGSRITWYQGYDNPELDRFIGPIGGSLFNVPFTWGDILTVDAYATFRVNDHFTAEIVATNLTDRFYVDPLTRSLNPAPGRTVRLSLTGRF